MPKQYYEINWRLVLLAIVFGGIAVSDLMWRTAQ